MRWTRIKGFLSSRMIAVLLAFLVALGTFPNMAFASEEEKPESIEAVDETAEVVETGNTKVYVYVKPEGQTGTINGHGYFTVGYITLALPFENIWEYSSTKGDKTLEQYQDKVNEAVKELNYEHNEWLRNCNIEWYTLHISDGADNYVSSGTPAWHLDGKVKAEELPELYSVTYDANNGSGKRYNDINMYTKSSLVTVMANDAVGFTADNRYKFIGWSTQKEAGGKLYSPGEVFAIEGETTLYAQWEEKKMARVTVRHQYFDLSDPEKSVAGKGYIEENKKEIPVGELFSTEFVYEFDGKTDWKVKQYQGKEAGYDVTVNIAKGTNGDKWDKPLYSVERSESGKPLTISFTPTEDESILEYDILLSYERGTKPEEPVQPKPEEPKAPEASVQPKPEEPVQPKPEEPKAPEIPFIPSTPTAPTAPTVPTENNGTTEITDTEVPLTEVPEKKTDTIEIVDEEVPLTDTPDEKEADEDASAKEIGEEEVPLSDVPKTGDSVMIYCFAFLVSFGGLVFMVLNRRKEQRK
ncbi:MAG: InlB B-repeat-containing protein [Acetivibrio ethanolgignens]